MGEDKRKHLELIQAVITRLAGNSFSIKGFAVGLIAVLGGFAAKDANPRFASALLFPALVFWGLDAYYLRQEKLFRKLYEKVVADDPKAPVFSMDPTPFASEVDGVGKVAFSATVRWLHMPILVYVIVLMVYAAKR
jgi:hypothetical protein